MIEIGQRWTKIFEENCQLAKVFTFSQTTRWPGQLCMLHSWKISHRRTALKLSKKCIVFQFYLNNGIWANRFQIYRWRFDRIAYLSIVYHKRSNSLKIEWPKRLNVLKIKKNTKRPNLSLGRCRGRVSQFFFVWAQDYQYLINEMNQNPNLTSSTFLVLAQNYQYLIYHILIQYLRWFDNIGDLII